MTEIISLFPRRAQADTHARTSESEGRDFQAAFPSFRVFILNFYGPCFVSFSSRWAKSDGQDQRRTTVSAVSHEPPAGPNNIPMAKPNSAKNNFLTLTLLGCFALLPLARAADSPGNIPLPTVPDALSVSSSEELSFVAKARGVQIYECRPKKDAAAHYEWVFIGPEAELFDANGNKIGRHFGGPTWESNDGSRVTGSVRATVPSKDPEAVPWLLLAAKGHEGTGVFSQVTSIQRLETAGGRAPAGGCSQANLGEKIRVPYTAIYCFYVSKS
jgi:hypothetical protein